MKKIISLILILAMLLSAMAISNFSAFALSCEATANISTQLDDSKTYICADGTYYEVEKGKTYTYIHYLQCNKKICAFDATTTYDANGLEFIPPIDKIGEIDQNMMFPVFKQGLGPYGNGSIRFFYSSNDSYCAEFPIVDSNILTKENAVIVAEFNVTGDEGVYNINTNIAIIGDDENNKVVFGGEKVDETAIIKTNSELVTPVTEIPTEKPTQTPTDVPTESPTQEPTETETVVTTNPTFDYIVLSDGTAKITYYKGSTRDITFPSHLDGYTVTSIADHAFEIYDDHEPVRATSVVFPNTIISIGEYAFYDNFLTDVVLPASVNYVGYNAFLMSSLESLTVLNPNCVFDDTVTYMNPTIYGYVGSTAEVYANKYGMNFIPLDDDASMYEYIVLDDGTAEITDYNGADTKASIPSHIDNYIVTSIGENAFRFSPITEVIIPNTVTTVKKDAFYICEDLTTVVISDSVLSIDINAFYCCENITSITIDKNNPVYDSRNNCDAIIHTATNTLVYGCQTTTVPNTVTTIGKLAFYQCQGLKSITIPESVTLIDKQAFYICEFLDEITILNPECVIFDSSQTIDSYTLIFGYAGSTAQAYATKYDRDFADVEGPPRTKDFECRILEDNTVEITKYHNYYVEIIIPETIKGFTVTSIGESAFTGRPGSCESSIIIPNTVTNIEDYAFSGCEHIEKMSIPESVVSLGKNAFRNCSRLNEITFLNPKCIIETTDTNGEYTIPTGTTVYGYLGSTAQEYAQKYGNEFVSLGDIPSDTVEITDTTTDISITTKDSVDLSVKVITNDKEVSDTNALLKDETVANLFDITISKNGETVQPSAPVSVKIPTDNENAKVYRVENNNALTDMNATYIDGYMVFTTDHFSKYVLTIPKATDAPTLGDVDGDGRISIIDATVIQRHLAKLANKVFVEAAADTDKDNKVSIIDATMIQRYLANLITEF